MSNECFGFVPSKKSIDVFGEEPPLVRLGVRLTQYCNLCCSYCSADAFLLNSEEIPVGGAINTHLLKSALKLRSSEP